jgi:hypothetical protein
MKIDTIVNAFRDTSGPQVLEAISSAAVELAVEEVAANDRKAAAYWAFISNRLDLLVRHIEERREVETFGPLDNIVASEGITNTETLYWVFRRFIENHIESCVQGRDVAPLYRLNARDIKKIQTTLARSLLDWDVREDDDNDGFIEELEAILSGFTPDGGWFGTHPDDGALTGYWPDHLCDTDGLLTDAERATLWPELPF